MRGFDDWLTTEPEPPYTWTCPECDEEIGCWTTRQMDDMECPACAEAESEDEDGDE